MKQLLKIEFRRAVKGKGMIISLVIGTLISMAHVIQYIIPLVKANATEFFVEYPILSPNNVAESWMGGNPANLEGFLFFLILPLIACMPFVTSYFDDYNSGFLKNIYTRISKKEYLLVKYVVTFLTAGIAVIFPLSVNLICSMMMLPNLVPTATYIHNQVNPLVEFYTLFYSHPIWYTLIYFLFIFLMAGIFACIGLVASFWTDYKIIVLISPFLIQLILHVVCTIIGKSEYSSVYWQQPGFGIVSLRIVFMYLGIGFLTTFLVFRVKGEKLDVF